MHDEHRERMRERLIRDGADTLAPHETLEMLLYYAIPREDTNPIAHRLIERFGSVGAALAADNAVLCQVDGIGPKTATYLKVVNSVLRTCALEEQRTAFIYDSSEKIAAYLRPLYAGLSVERVYLLLFDNRMSMLACEHISDGTVNCAAPKLRRMMDAIVRYNASTVVLSHSHPNGIALPSGDDIQLTNTLESYFAAVGVRLLEHFVVSGNQCTGIMNSGGRYSPSGAATFWKN